MPLLEEALTKGQLHPNVMLRGPLLENSADCAFGAADVYPGHAYLVNAAAHHCRLHVLCRPSEARLQCKLRGCLLGTCSASSSPQH